MLETKIQTENSCIHYEELDEAFSEIEEELEKKTMGITRQNAKPEKLLKKINNFLFR